MTNLRLALRLVRELKRVGRPMILALEHQPQRQPEVRRIGDADQEARDILARQAPEDDVAGDDFIEAAGAQRIGSRQIDQPHGEPGGRDDRALLALDRDTGIVGDLLPAAGQRIEECRLPAVRVADQGDAGR